MQAQRPPVTISRVGCIRASFHSIQFKSKHEIYSRATASSNVNVLAATHQCICMSSRSPKHEKSTTRLSVLVSDLQSFANPWSFSAWKSSALSTGLSVPVFVSEAVQKGILFLTGPASSPYLNGN